MYISLLRLKHRFASAKEVYKDNQTLLKAIMVDAVYFLFAHTIQGVQVFHSLDLILIIKCLGGNNNGI